MAMKPIAVVVLIALFSAASVAAAAKTVTTSQGNADATSTAGVAGPAVAANNSQPDTTPAAHPGKKALKKAKITPPPPMHDPN
jgi:hypothetical protein